MNIRSILFIIFIMLFSCSEDDSSPPPMSSVSFSVDGTNYSWKQVDDPRSDDFFQFSILQSYGAGQYTFYADRSGSPWSYPEGRSIRFSIPTNSITVNTAYTVTNENTATDRDAITIVTRSNIYESTAAGDFGSITITKLQNNLADGIFSARLTRRVDNATVEVTSGQFKNVEVTNN